MKNHHFPMVFLWVPQKKISSEYPPCRPQRLKSDVLRKLGLGMFECDGYDIISCLVATARSAWHGL